MTQDDVVLQITDREDRDQENDQKLVDSPARSENVTKLEDLLLRQEDTRSLLAKYLVGLFAGVIVLTFLYIFLSPVLPTHQECQQLPNTTTICTPDDTAADLITLVLSSLTTIVGTALGFYFGSKSKN